MDRAAALALVNEHPFAVAAHRYGNGFHGSEAIRRPVTRLIVDVAAPQAERTVVAVLCAERRRGDFLMAMDAAKRLRLLGQCGLRRVSSPCGAYARPPRRHLRPHR